MGRRMEGGSRLQGKKVCARIVGVPSQHSASRSRPRLWLRAALPASSLPASL